MLRGGHTARIDDKGRLKVPSEFRALIEQRYGSLFFVTSLTGEYARLYPMPVWEAIESRLAALPTTDPTRVKFLDIVNYYGQTAEMDGQGRVLIPARLRESARLVGEVDVAGHVTHLDVWNAERNASRIAANPMTDDDLRRLAAAGI